MAKCSEILRFLYRNGWVMERQRGSHIVLGHPDRTNKIVFPNHGSQEMKVGTLHAVLKSAGLHLGEKKRK
ncbi:type II toxin-antitoxin system HicA family toxin [Chryseolinea lacunae]